MDVDPDGEIVPFGGPFTVTRVWDILDPICSEGVSLDEKQRTYTNWREFARNVCAPLVLSDGDWPEDALRLFRGESGYYMATALFMADNALTRCENGTAGSSGRES